MAVAAAKNSFGNKLWAATTGGSLAVVAELLSLSPPSLDRAMQDATTLDQSGQAQRVIPEGTYKVGPMTGQVHYIAGSAGDDLMIAALTTGALYDFKIVLKAASGTEDLLFSGYVTQYSPDEQTPNGKQTASFTIQPDGAITQAASA